MYRTSGFMRGDVMFSHTGRGGYATRTRLRVTQQVQHGFETAANTRTDPPEGSTGQTGAVSDVYDCLAEAVD